MKPFSHGTLIEATNNNVAPVFPEQMLRAKVVSTKKEAGKEAGADEVNQIIKSLRDRLAPKMGSGVCLAMSCLWIDQMIAGGTAWLNNLSIHQSVATAQQTLYQTDSLQTALGDILVEKTPNVDIIEHQAFLKMARDFFALVPYRQDRADGTFGKKPGEADDFCRFMLQLMERQGASYLLSIGLEGGSHAMAMHVERPWVLFLDPNFGVYKYGLPEQCARDLRWLVWGWEGEAPYHTAVGKRWRVIRLVRA
jgi:hypothetical protein